jgi:hypothetical protein
MRRQALFWIILLEIKKSGGEAEYPTGLAWML